MKFRILQIEENKGTNTKNYYVIQVKRWGIWHYFEDAGGCFLVLTPNKAFPYSLEISDCEKFITDADEPKKEITKIDYLKMVCKNYANFRSSSSYQIKVIEEFTA